MTRKLFAYALILVLCLSGIAYSESTKQLAAGSYTVEVPESFVNGEVTEEDKAEGLTAYYKSDATTLDFDVYQLKSDKPLAEFAADDAKIFNGTDIAADLEINGIKAASYRSRQESEGTMYNVISYVFGENGEYVRLTFWLDGENAEAEAKAIIDSLKK